MKSLRAKLFALLLGIVAFSALAAPAMAAPHHHHKHHRRHHHHRAR